MEELEIKIINFDHLLVLLNRLTIYTSFSGNIKIDWGHSWLRNRRRVRTQKRAMVNKVEKLLDVLPQVIFSQGILGKPFASFSNEFHRQVKEAG